MRPGVYCLLAGQGLSLYPALTDPRSLDDAQTIPVHLILLYVSSKNQGSAVSWQTSPFTGQTMAGSANAIRHNN